MEIYLLFIKRAHAAGEQCVPSVRVLGALDGWDMHHVNTTLRKTRRNGCPGYVPVEQQQRYQAFKINAIGYTLDGMPSPVLFLCLSLSRPLYPSSSLFFSVPQVTRAGLDHDDVEDDNGDVCIIQ